MSTQSSPIANSSIAAEIDEEISKPIPDEELYQIIREVSGVVLHFRSISASDAQDCIHEVFLVVADAIGRGILRDPTCLRAYIHTITRRKACQIVRGYIMGRERNRDNSGNGLPTSLDQLHNRPDPRPGPEQLAMVSEGRGIMTRILEALPETDREILLRFYCAEQTREEICADLGITEDQFRLRKSRAKLKFEKLVAARSAQRTAAVEPAINHLLM